MRNETFFMQIRTLPLSPCSCPCLRPSSSNYPFCVRASEEKYCAYQLDERTFLSVARYSWTTFLSISTWGGAMVSNLLSLRLR